MYVVVKTQVQPVGRWDRGPMLLWAGDHEWTDALTIARRFSTQGAAIEALASTTLYAPDDRLIICHFTDILPW